MRSVSPLDLFADDEDRVKFRAALERDGKVTASHVRFRLKDGSVRAFEGNLQLVGAPPSNQTHAVDSPTVVLMFRDITDRLRAEEELQARICAEAANRLKSEFLANMSHEIRTPMHAVLSFAYLALQTELTERQRDYLTKIETSGRGLLHIVNDILDFSKVEAGKLELEQVDFSLDDVMDDLVANASGAAAKKNLELVVSVAPGVPSHLRGDATRLGQVLLNLVSNAIKFTAL
jgi:signal transduction histidine kinase